MILFNRNKKPLILNYKLNEVGIPPVYSTDGSAGLDIFYPYEKELLLPSGESATFDTGLSVEIPNGYVGLMAVRSSIGFKYETQLTTGMSVIDSDFRGTIKVKVRNFGNQSFTIKQGERVAQMIILPYEQVQLNRVFELEETERGEGGIGSTGK